VFPQANANATFFNESTTGKLKGEIPATTPNGRRIAMEIIPGTSEGNTSPRMRRASPAIERTRFAANGTSKWALPKVEPASSIKSSIISSEAFSSSSAARIKMRSRSAASVAPQAFFAASAASIAARMCCSCAMKIRAKGR
jgi:hypothetical protein